MKILEKLLLLVAIPLMMFPDKGYANTVFVPAKFGVVCTYQREMIKNNATHGWKADTLQGKLRKDAIEQGRQERGDIFSLTDVAIIDGRIEVATTPNIGGELEVEVGDYIDVIYEDGTVWNCIIADMKNTKDADCSAWGHLNGKSVVEIIYWNSKGNSGNQYKKIEAIRKAGNFWEEYAFE